MTSAPLDSGAAIRILVRIVTQAASVRPPAPQYALTASLALLLPLKVQQHAKRVKMLRLPLSQEHQPAIFVKLVHSPNPKRQMLAKLAKLVRPRL